jgi:hypothetical protein
MNYSNSRVFNSVLKNEYYSALFIELRLGLLNNHFISRCCIGDSERHTTVYPMRVVGRIRRGEKDQFAKTRSWNVVIIIHHPAIHDHRRAIPQTWQGTHLHD